MTMNRQQRRAAEARAKSEDKAAARHMVEEDARRGGRLMREMVGKDHVEARVFDDPMPVYEDGGAGAQVNLVIGTRDDLSVSHAEASAHKWREVVQQYPKAFVYILLLGYDEDPREIHEIESAAHYVRVWAQLAGITDFEQTALGPIGPTGAAFLAACGVFGDEIKRQIKVPPATAKN